MERKIYGFRNLQVKLEKLRIAIWHLFYGFFKTEKYLLRISRLYQLQKPNPKKWSRQNGVEITHVWLWMVNHIALVKSKEGN